MAERRISPVEELAKLENNSKANEAECRAVEDQVHYARKRNLTEEFTTLTGKLFLYLRLRYYREVILQGIEQSLDQS